MANWYNTQFTLTGAPKDVETAEALFKSLPVDSYGELQLIDVAEAIGCDPEQTFCAGYIENDTIIRDGDRIDFITCTKWQPPYQVIYALCQRYDSLKYYFMAQLDTYITNDAEGRFYPDRVYVELSQGDTIVEDGFKTIGEALAWINESTGQHFVSEEEATQYFDSDGVDDDSYCIFHHIKIVDESEQLTFIPQENPMNLTLVTPDGTPTGEITVKFGNQN